MQIFLSFLQIQYSKAGKNPQYKIPCFGSRGFLIDSGIKQRKAKRTGVFSPILFVFDQAR